MDPRPPHATHTHYIYILEQSNVSLGTSGSKNYLFLEKMAKLFANSGDPDQTPRSVTSDLGMQYLPVTLLGLSRLQWVNKILRCNEY